MRVPRVPSSFFAALLALTAVPFVGRAETKASSIEFDPKVGATGSRVVLRTTLPAGSSVRFGGRAIPVLREADGKVSLLVPPGAQSAFIEVERDGMVVARSAVPFVVSGASVAPGTAKLVGLREAIDVFGYFEARPEGGERPELPGKTIFKLDDQDILTLGEAPPAVLGPAVDLGDVSSAARQGMGQPGLLFTARPPKRKPVTLKEPPLVLPTPTPASAP